MRFNASIISQNGESLYILVLVKKIEISELIEDSDDENTKRQIKYTVSRMHLKNYDISCFINSSAKRKSLFWYHTFGALINIRYWYIIVIYTSTQYTFFLLF